jgi:ribosome assembly protein 1
MWFSLQALMAGHSGIELFDIRVYDFAKMYAMKLGCKMDVLLRALWGNYYFDPKEKKITSEKALKGRNLKPLFVQFVLENIWTIYDSLLFNYNPEMIEKVVKSLNLKIPPKELKSKDTSIAIHAIFSQWLPLSKAILMTIVEKIPSPVSSQSKTVPLILPSLKAENFKNGIFVCSSDVNFPLVAYIAKIISVPYSSIQKQTDNEGEELIAVARIYSGEIFVGQKLYILESKCEVIIDSLYLLMGRDLESLTSVPAGNICGIGGLGSFLFKTASLSSTLDCPPFVNTFLDQNAAIVRVAIEPVNPLEIPILTNGLKLLSQSDPVVQVVVQETGENVLITTGELHLERCLRDLKERFAKIDVHVSPPIVPFRETVFSSFSETISSQKFTLTLSCFQLDLKIIEFLEQSTALVKKFDYDYSDESLKEFKSTINTLISKVTTGKILSFGPKRFGPNILINNCKDSSISFENYSSSSDIFSVFANNIITGFQLATYAGPLCAEPMYGVAFSIDHYSLIDETSSLQDYGAIGGQIISSSKELFKKLFMNSSPRIMLAVYNCAIQATSDVLGKVYGCVAKRKGKILSEEMQEGTTFFVITATIPVVESFGFCDDIRKRTSGAAQPQLIFKGFEVLDEDPFWTPSTEIELEDLGEKADKVNIAKKYIESVRKRKGLFVEDKLVEHAEKQRTLKIK